MSDVISLAMLRRLIDQKMSEGARVAGPRQIGQPARVLYDWLQSSAQLALGGFVHPGNSIKEIVFPRHETLYGYRGHGKHVELVDAAPPTAEQIVVGARPCDAAALPLLDHVFNWDSRDTFYNDRRRLTTVVTLACGGYDADCFCTSVGGGPAGEQGSDAMLIDLGDDVFEVRCITEKGTRLFSGHTESSTRGGQVPEGPPQRIDLAAVERFLAAGFESPAWALQSRRCLGCGACAYSCPTCHCFDIIDEGRPGAGTRVRNWDACQFAMFTVHASGHNPRSVQPQRQRQRIYHKFQIYREKFGQILCTGCGNCTRNCPVGLGVRPVLESIEQQGQVPS